MASAGQQGRVVVALFLAALLWQVAFAAAIDGPTQWDSAYAWEVARNLASGKGAVSEAVWTMAWLPPTVSHPADLHWSPLPSRVLVPAMWVSHSWRAVQVIPVLLAALWAPLGWAWARHVGLPRGLSALAGLLAGTGLGSLPFLGVPDSVGLFGLLAGGALLSASKGRTWVCVLLCVLAALTRGDGFLLGLACAVSLPGWRGLWAAAGGIGATGLWALRNLAVAGQGFIDLRARVSSAQAVGDLLLLNDPAALGVVDRLANGVWAVPGSTVLALLQTGILPGVFAALALVLRRRDRSLWAIVVFLVLVIVVDNLLAPGIAGKGTVYRTLSGLLPAIAALSVLGATDVLRGLPRWMLPLVVAGGGLAISLGVGRSLGGAFVVYDDCAVMRAAGVPNAAPVLAYEPVQLTARCGNPAVQIPPDATPAQLDDLAHRYGIEWAVVAPVAHAQPAWREGTVTIDGWSPAGARVLRRH